MTVDQLQLAFAARDEAIDQVNRNADGWERDVIDQAILHFADTGRAFSANTFRELLPEIRNRNLIGGRIKALSQRKPPPYVCIGKVTSNDPGTHAKDIGLYRKTPIDPDQEKS